MPRPQYAGIFKHKFRENYPNKSCVYKIWAADYFFIWKCQALHNSMYHIGGDIERRVRLGPKPGNIFSKLVDHLVSENISELEVEVILQSDDPFELLKLEHETLLLNSGNKKCLNTSFKPHISGWIPAGSVQKYNDFLTTKKSV